MRATLRRPAVIAVKQEGWDLYRDGVTQTLLQRFFTCPEKLRLSYRERLSPLRQSDALRFGDIGHRFLEQFYGSGGNLSDEDLSTLVETQYLADLDRLTKALALQAEKDDLAKSYALLEASILAYARYWRKDLVRLKWVGLEDLFTVPYTLRGVERSATVPIRGKIDGAYRSGKTNRLRLFESKFKGEIDGPRVVGKLDYDLQVLLYGWAAWKKYGEYPEGVTYNLIRRPLLRQKASESILDFSMRVREDIAGRPDFYYARYDVEFIPGDLERFEETLGGMLFQLAQWDKGLFHWKASWACSLGGVNCEFLNLCTTGNRNGYTVRTEVHPELEVIQ